jgi:hypothetical protein
VGGDDAPVGLVPAGDVNPRESGDVARLGEANTLAAELDLSPLHALNLAGLRRTGAPQSGEGITVRERAHPLR